MFFNNRGNVCLELSFCSSTNCLLGSILPVVPFLSDHFNDFNTPHAQPSVSAMWPPKSFSFDGQFALITPVPIAMTIFLEITPPAIRTPVTTSFTFTRRSSSRLLVYLYFCAQWHYHFFCLFKFFSFFTDVFIKVYLGYCFPNFSNADFVPCIKAYSPTSFLMRSGTEVL